MLIDTVTGPIAMMALGLVVSAVFADRGIASWLLAPALAAGFVIALVTIQGRPVWPPAAALDVLAAAAVLGAVAEWVRRGLGLEWRGSLLLGAILVAGCGAWMLWPILSRGALLPGVLAVAGVVLLFAAMHVLSCPTFRSTRNGAWMILAVTAAPVIGIDGSLKLGQFAGALGAGLGTVWLGGLLLRRETVDLPLLAPTLLTLVYAAAWFYAETDDLALGVLVLAALLSQGLAHATGIRSRVVGHLLLAATSAVALGLALWRVWPEQSLY